jgi:biopolymer transport protein TolQ
MQLTMEREMRTLERHIGTLATTWLGGPFVGLYGTVWGIMTASSRSP